MNTTSTEWRLSARQAIDALNSEFAYLIDNGRSQIVPDLFTDDGSYAIRRGDSETVSKGRDAIRAAYALRAQRGQRTSCHIFTNLHLTATTADEATGSCLLLLFAQDGPPPHPASPLMVARYDDRYVRAQDGTWKYASRIATSLFEHESGAPIALPLGQST